MTDGPVMSPGGAHSAKGDALALVRQCVRIRNPTARFPLALENMGLLIDLVDGDADGPGSRGRTFAFAMQHTVATGLQHDFAGVLVRGTTLLFQSTAPHRFFN